MQKDFPLGADQQKFGSPDEAIFTPFCWSAVKNSDPSGQRGASWFLSCQEGSLLAGENRGTDVRGSERSF
jgi:hypothetical protein